MKPLHVIRLMLFAVLTTAQQVQFCHQRAIRKSDICLALTTSPNSTSADRDLNLHLSARLPEQGKGWVGFGVGMKMDHSLMFSMYSGAIEDSKSFFSFESSEDVWLISRDWPWNE
jgi:hypothetical protein